MKDIIMTYLFIFIWIALLPFAVSKIVNGSFRGAIGYGFETSRTETTYPSESERSVLYDDID